MEPNGTSLGQKAPLLWMMESSEFSFRTLLYALACALSTYNKITRPPLNAVDVDSCLLISETPHPEVHKLLALRTFTV